MIDKTHQLSVRQQSQLIQINRSTLYYKPKEISSTDLSLMRLIDEIHIDYPFMGSRMIRDMLQRQGHQIGRRKVRRRKVLAHRVSISMETDFCIDALQEAIVKYGCPEVFNTDQGSQFTSEAFLNELKLRNISISMDGKGRWRDNVMIERLWRSLKHEEVYLKAYDTVKQAKQSIAEYLDFYKHLLKVMAA